MPTDIVAPQGPYQLTKHDFDRLPVDRATMQRRIQIKNLEQSMLALVGEGDPEAFGSDYLKPVHYFSRGMYVRELRMPAGYTIVGKRHAREHIVIISEGRCLCITERGSEELRAPCSFISPAGEKRALYMLEDTTWVTIHRTEATNLEDAEADLILAEEPVCHG
jgi:quercetin dioxygenase-like cupin family protein